MRREMHTHLQSENEKGRRYLVDIGIDGILILERTV
jgi:hypothetical protein